MLFRSGLAGAEVANLDPKGMEELSGVPVAALLDDFYRGDAPREHDGLRIGEALLARLLSGVGVRQTWNEIRAHANGRPLRVVLVLPRDADQVNRLPFELLAESGTFLFRQYRSALVRTFAGLDVFTVDLSQGAALFAWANPPVEGEIGRAHV